MLVVQRGCNLNGSFFSPLEFGHEKRGMIVVLEGRKGEGWRKLGDILKELMAHSSALSVRNIVASIPWSSQADKLKVFRGDGVAPLLTVDASRSYNEVLQAQKLR